MNTLFWSGCLFLLLLFGLLPASAQNTTDKPHATIHFLRTGAFRGSACRTDIKLPNQSSFNLPLAGMVNYTIYSTGEIPVTLELYYPPASSIRPPARRPPSCCCR